MRPRCRLLSGILSVMRSARGATRCCQTEPSSAARGRSGAPEGRQAPQGFVPLTARVGQWRVMQSDVSLGSSAPCREQGREIRSIDIAVAVEIAVGPSDRIV